MAAAGPGPRWKEAAAATEGGSGRGEGEGAGARAGASPGLRAGIPGRSAGGGPHHSACGDGGGPGEARRGEGGELRRRGVRVNRGPRGRREDPAPSAAPTAASSQSDVPCGGAGKDPRPPPALAKQQLQ